jgi:hypothetical protein
LQCTAKLQRWGSWSAREKRNTPVSGNRALDEGMLMGGVAEKERESSKYLAVAEMQSGYPLFAVLCFVVGFCIVSATTYTNVNILTIFSIIIFYYNALEWGKTFSWVIIKQCTDLPYR